MIKMITCEVCGSVYHGKSCPNCVTRRAHIGNCFIEESQGRCEENLKGECDECLFYCAYFDWEGWRKITEEEFNGG